MSPVTRRFLLAFGGALALVWVAVRVTLTVAPPVREAWTVLAVGVDTDVLFARLSVADTGFYARQLTTRLFLLRQGAATIEHRAMYGPTTLDDGGVASGPDRLTRTARGWELRVGGDAVQAGAVIDGAAPSCPPEPGTISGTLGTSPAGAEGSFDGGTLLRGDAVVVRTRSEGREEGAALYVLGPGVRIGVDPLASCPAWAVVGEDRWAGPALPIPSTQAGMATVGPYTVTWRATAATGFADSLAHVGAGERLAAVAVGWPAATLNLVRVGVRVEGPGFDERRTGVLLVRGTAL